jgi:hypothetical protein
MKELNPVVHVKVLQIRTNNHAVAEQLPRDFRTIFNFKLLVVVFQIHREATFFHAFLTFEN